MDIWKEYPINMHHFSKQINKKLWWHVALSFGSALITVALFDTLSSFSWLCKDYEIVGRYSSDDSNKIPLHSLDVLYWIFVSYRMVLSLVICIGGIFMGRRIIVIVWLVISLIIDLIHLGETIFILSQPNLMETWPVVAVVSSCIWQELKIIRIKYRIIRRSLLVDTNSNNVDLEYDPLTIQWGMRSHCSEMGKFHLMMVGINPNDIVSNGANSHFYIDYKNEGARRKSVKINNEKRLTHVATNVIHFIKLVRNLYNLLTWHFAGYLFGGDYHHLISTNYKAVVLEQRFIRYARVFLDVLTVIYIVQEKRVLLTPWIMAYIMIASASIAIFLFVLLQLDLLTTLFVVIYYLVFSIDLFFRCGFLIFCIRYVVQTKRLV